MAGYTRQSAADIVADNIISADFFNAEFDALQGAFNNVSGHAHDGTVGNGPRISLVASVSGVLPLANGGTGATNAANARTNLGLGNVNNTTDLNKPISTATQTALDGKLNTSHQGVGGDVHATVTTTVNGFMIAADKAKLDGIATGAQVNTVTSVAGRTGAVALVKSDVGLNNVDNTSDTNKPVSIAQQAALDARVRVDAPQGLTNVQREHGRLNIGASAAGSALFAGESGPTVTNYNTTITPGKYSGPGNPAGVPGAPPGNAPYGGVEVTTRGDIVLQHAFYGSATSTFESYLRGSNDAGATWGEWIDALGAGVDALFDGPLDKTSNEQAVARQNVGANDASNLTTGTLPDARVSQSLDPTRAFRRGNILGAVSQSSSIPTGAIIERGANANGEYVRFADGTQICRINDLQLSYINNANISGSWTLPVAFTSLPMVISQLRYNSFTLNFRSGAFQYSREITTVNATIGLASNGQFVASDANADRMQAFAIGRWF